MDNKASKSFLQGISQYYPLFFTIVFIIILCQYSFFSFESVFYDLRVKYDIGTDYKDNVVIVTMDEESDQYLGENYPYSYAGHQRLMARLVQDKPSVVSYIVALNDSESEQEQVYFDSFKKEVEGFVANGGMFRFSSEMDAWGEQRPPEGLRDIGYSLALVNQDNATFAKDDVTRRAILNISGESSLHLWVANGYRKKRGEDLLNISNIKGAYYLREADATFALFRYMTSPLDGQGRVKTIPFHRVVVGNFPRGFFTDKVVLVGPSYLSNANDFVLTPYDKEEYRSPKIKVHAAIIKALIDGKTVFKVPRSVTNVLALILAIVLSLIISKVNPGKGLLITIYVMIGAFLLAFLVFSFFGIWIYLTHIIFTIFVVYYIWVPFRAINEYQYRYAIQEETKLLKKVENLKQNFISLMSHDLKTPVAKIAGLADNMIQRNKENTDLVGGLNLIVDSTKELNNFITSILDLTKVESRNLTLNMVSKDINTIIDSIASDLRYQAGNKEISIETELGPLYPIEIDVKLITRVISNLVENAIKYAGEGCVIKVTTWDDEQWVYVEIKDDGVGIPPEPLEHIFEKFYRVKNDASHSIKGSGLGLYLVKYFVELHGGSIKAESTVGEGTTFTIKLKNM